MAVIDLPSRGKPVTSKRPTVSDPVTRGAAIEKHVARIDQDLDFLYCIYATLAGGGEVPEEAVEGLRTLHERMQNEVNAIYMLG